MTLNELIDREYRDNWIGEPIDSSAKGDFREIVRFGVILAAELLKTKEAGQFNYDLEYSLRSAAFLETKLREK